MLFIFLVAAYLVLKFYPTNEREGTYIDRSVNNHYNYYDNRSVNYLGGDEIPVDKDKIT